MKILTKNLTLNERVLVDNVLKFIKSMTIKNESAANKYETTDSLKNGNKYVYCMKYGTNVDFYYFSYERDDYKKVIEEIESSTLNKMNKYQKEEYIEKRIGELTPYVRQVNDVYRETLIKNKVNDVIDNYEETNDYYRMLNGEPPIDTIQSDFIYTNSGKAIHLLNEKEFYSIQKSGEYESILKDNPEKQYLFHINPANKIDYFTSRSSKKFHIMKYDKSLLEEIYVKQILDFYYEVYLYTTSVVYAEPFMKQEYYDSFIIIYMLMATLQKFFANIPNNIIKRELYDIESIRNMFYSYGLPFFEEIPLKYQRKILKNINTLLAYKGTDKIFIDIADIFGFKDTEIFRYYLVKDYVRDANGKPLLNLPMDLKFAQVSTEEKDISSYLNSDYLYQKYEDVVGDDPYWGENDNGEIDEEFKDEIREYDFNYISTKYLSITTIFNMTKCTFETTYFFSMLNEFQNNNLLDDFYFVNSTMKSSGGRIKVFSAITAIYILLFRRFGYTDRINYEPTSIGCIYGFNYRYPEEEDTDIEYLKDIMYNKSEIDVDGKKLHYWSNETIEEFEKIIKLPTNETKEQLLKDFLENKKFNEELKDAINNSKDLREYKTLNAIYQFNMYSQSIKKLYGNKYGTMDEYETYTDWLKDNDEELYDWVDNSCKDENGEYNKENIVKTLDIILESLEMYFDNTDELEYLFINTNVTLDFIKKYFIKMISIFKAYTVELKRINVYYIFDDKYLNTIRLFDFLKFKVKNTLADSFEENIYDEIISKIRIYLKENDLEGLKEFIDTIVKVEKKEDINLILRTYSNNNFLNGNAVGLNDFAEIINNNMTLLDKNKIINGREELDIAYSFKN